MYIIKKSIAAILLATACFLFVNAAEAETARPMPSDLKFPDLTFSPPKPEKIELENGMVLYLLEDHELPVLDIKAMVRSGAAYEPEKKLGLAGLTATVMRTGGTASMTGDQIDETLEFIAGDIGLDSNYTNISASLSVLKKDMDLGLKIFSQILINPVFNQDKLDLAKKSLIESIRRKNEYPSAIARREFRKLLYAGHPFGRVPSIESVSSVTRDDLIEFHRKFFHPARIIVCVSGDFKKDEMAGKIRDAFKGWNPKAPPLPAIKPLEKKFRYSVNYIEKDTTQSVIRLGHLGVKISNPDHYALQLMDDILGGNSFQSRLMQDIRTDRGLAYSVWSYFSAGVFDYGAFTVGVETKAQSTAKVIELILGHLNKMRNEAVAREELDSAKRFIKNSFVFKFDTSSKIVNRMGFFKFYDIPMNYLETYLENIEKVTRQDILRVAREYLKPDGLIITVVGDKKKFDRPLTDFGEVNTIKLEKFE